MTTVGPEQEYFLIDKEDYQKRLDLVLYAAARCSALRRPRARSWRTTTSARSSPVVAGFMKELDEELWKLGILAKTKHNEVAPCPA